LPQLSESKDFGLKEDWNKVEQVLEDIIPVYDKTNRYISLGSDLNIRREGLNLLKELLGDIQSEFSIVDLGAGTGKLTELLAQPTIMVDALLPMLQTAAKRNESSEPVLAIFENMPFKGEVFRAAMAAFSIRDAQNLKRAISQIKQIVRVGGFLLIIDLTKPDSKWKRGMVALYWRVFAPLIAFAAAGKPGLKFGALSTTFKRLPTKTQFVTTAQEAGFELVSTKFFMLDGVGIFLLCRRV
jgi:demethylmenaquinone methyltransferase/2-methoxy-6-polyprenyl-1,4-benzoquinol methylase